MTSDISNAVDTVYTTGKIIGIVIGCIFAVAILTGVIITIICLCKKKTKVGGTILQPPPLYNQQYPYAYPANTYASAQQFSNAPTQQSSYVPVQQFSNAPPKYGQAERQDTTLNQQPNETGTA
ncbi:unnamed protein product [Didymodactylos carnosus]|uniref:Uncharacterized protein n=1 Tax=Didymodactylos carnosus TaxID=1234261 RepID=A0A8S2F3H9_9BILA|nr:unnamed protein product [Didymodactylos carnosus]CAF4154218.1 unnamed protein product [Didymodactylos carnosus]